MAVVGSLPPLRRQGSDVAGAPLGCPMPTSKRRPARVGPPAGILVVSGRLRFYSASRCQMLRLLPSIIHAVDLHPRSDSSDLTSLVRWRDRHEKADRLFLGRTYGALSRGHLAGRVRPCEGAMIQCEYTGSVRARLFLWSRRPLRSPAYPEIKRFGRFDRGACRLTPSSLWYLPGRDRGCRHKRVCRRVLDNAWHPSR